jgi:hypothetical protein
LLQQAVANPAMKSDVLVLLGECFVRDGKLDLVARIRIICVFLCLKAQRDAL